VGERENSDREFLSRHVPVLQQETLSWLNLRAGSLILDCTVGYCGHAREILKSSAPHGIVIGIDRDPHAIEFCRKKTLKQYGTRLILIRGHFVDLKRHLSGHGFSNVDGVLFDLGVSSPQLDDPERGFSFQVDGPLDMRMDPAAQSTAADIVNHAEEIDLADMIFRFGEERFSRRIARAIVRARSRRPFSTTRELVSVIESSVPAHYRRGRLHCATRTFQALRIAVNQELEHLESALRDAVDVLRTGGRLCVISFHSLEDRIVKNTFRSLSGTHVSILTKKPQVPMKEEMDRNPRSRSAKLRVVERLALEGHS
jgi:16S rRNA (cytosine1402-N4)-methyltransferase